MNKKLLLACLLALGCSAAFAQPGPGPGPGGGPGPRGGGQRGMMDCSRAIDPALCESHRAARQQAWEACRGKYGVERRRCMQTQMVSPDCAKSPDPATCERHQKARQACQDSMGPAHMQCLRDYLAPGNR
ncbi:hypothetical protein OTERR_19610 [Oryzomicrobium terrae]|uniref:Uncharacterized protein n=1 Tax=Oryzomicrobium terrae TaxID=1735038 RepID=A0A5C1EB67_9RHOO|nr:hypothetical protein [Oryzomicrobium terrae]QEL65437.1 hypothetical protein OTERR_19610 [Oryzomicrobium terrae]